jgi:oxysterol-binding protein-related protein 9/10/11
MATTTNRSGLKEFLASIATIKGDLSNITAPPFLLATQSTTQLPSYWAEFADHFTAPANAEDPLIRSVLVLKWFLVCLKRQQYAGQVCLIFIFYFHRWFGGMLKNVRGKEREMSD